MKKRKYIRFKPEENTVVYFNIPGRESSKKIHALGLVFEESAAGFGCLMLSEQAPQAEEVCFVKLGPFSTVKAICIWRNNLDASAAKVGFKYLE